MHIRVLYTQPGHKPEVRVLELEEYLRGVVPNESDERWPVEALRAQAVASRTYAVHKAMQKPQPDPGYDVVAGVNDQVWLPGTQPRSDAAVAATGGEILQSDNKPVLPYFFTTSIGHTESNDVVFGTADIPYLQGVASPGAPDDLSDEARLRAFLSSDPPVIYDYAPENKRTRWNVTFSRQQVEQHLARSGAVKKLLAGKALGTLQDLRVIRRGQSGMAAELELIGEQQTLRLGPASAIRNSLGLYSAWFVIDTGKDSAGELTTLTFQGGGWGHGTGMSQWGAHGMAARGYTYANILAFYYPGTKMVHKKL